MSDPSADGAVAPLAPMGMGVDQHAVLFRSSDRVVRAIRPASASFYRALLDHACIRELIAKRLLVPTDRSAIPVDGYDLVLEHPLLPVTSYPFEWTPSMLKDAARVLLEINRILVPHGLCTHDAHPWNLLFDGTRPRFVDFTSIEPLPPDGRWRAIDQYGHYCMNPLMLMERGFPTSARTLMREIFAYPDPRLIAALVPGAAVAPSNRFNLDSAVIAMRDIVDRLPRGAGTTIRSVVRRLRLLRGFQNVRAMLRPALRVDGVKEIEDLLVKLESIRVRPPASDWSDYYSGRNELPTYDGTRKRLDATRKATPKHMAVDQLLARLRPVSVLDLGCNRGLYSQMAATHGARAIGVDTDEQALDLMYDDSKALGTQVLPLFVNAVAPAEAIGYKELPFPSVTERLRSELVLCLALVHHWVFKGMHMSFEHIAQVLSSYSSRYVLVEFVPIQDEHIRGWYTPRYDWYSLDNFCAALSRQFGKIERFESFPAPRVLLLCEKTA